MVEINLGLLVTILLVLAFGVGVAISLAWIMRLVISNKRITTTQGMFVGTLPTGVMLFLVALFVGLWAPKHKSEYSKLFKAARAGNIEAIWRLSHCYANGIGGVPKDENEAEKWRHEAQKLEAEQYRNNMKKAVERL